MGLGTQTFFFAGAPGLGRELYKASPCSLCPVSTVIYPSAPAPELVDDANVKILGNPVRESLVVEVSPGSSQPVSLELLNLNGSVLAKQQVRQTGKASQITFDLKNSSAGLLLLRINTENETKLTKIVKVD